MTMCRKVYPGPGVYTWLCIGSVSRARSIYMSMHRKCIQGQEYIHDYA